MRICVIITYVFCARMGTSSRREFIFEVDALLPFFAPPPSPPPATSVVMIVNNVRRVLIIIIIITYTEYALE